MHAQHLDIEQMRRVKHIVTRHEVPRQDPTAEDQLRTCSTFMCRGWWHVRNMKWAGYASGRGPSKRASPSSGTGSHATAEARCWR
jgi:hypothetical protein